MEDRCHVCCFAKALKKCGACFLTAYCSKQCQKQDWKDHQLVCAGTKRKWGSFDATEEDREQRTRREEPAGYKLDQRLKDQLENPAFLRSWVRQNTFQSIMDRVSQAEVGFYGALNASNLFWYFVYTEKQPYAPEINYKEKVIKGSFK